MSYLKEAAKYVAIAIAVFIAYLVLKPNDVWPVKWMPKENPGFTGDFSPNELLASMEQISTLPYNGPEDIAIDKEGNIYGGTIEGKILKFAKGSKEFSIFADTKGRPLGLDFDTSGNLIVADAHRGLLSIDTAGKITFLTSMSDSILFKFTDDVEVGSDGKYYFSDASKQYTVEDYKMDLFAHHPNGRLLCYDPVTQTTTTLLDKLYFANGVAVSDSSDFVLVVQTSEFNIVKYWLKGPKAGQKEIILDNLPGFPDGISRGKNGIFWIAVASPRDALLDKLSPHPRTRKYIANLPKPLLPAPKPYGMVIGIDANGKVLKNLQDPKGPFSPITSIQEENGVLYLGSLTASAFGILKKY